MVGSYSIAYSTTIFLAISLLACTRQGDKDSHSSNGQGTTPPSYKVRNASEFLGNWTGTMRFSASDIPTSVASKGLPDSVMKISAQIQGLPGNDSLFIFFFYDNKGERLFGLPAYFEDGKMQFDSEKNHDVDKLMALMIALMSRNRNIKRIKFHAVMDNTDRCHYLLSADATYYNEGKQYNFVLQIKGELVREN